MDPLQQLVQDMERSASPLVGPKALEHSQELAEGLPLVRRRTGPRAWYQCLEQSTQTEREPR